MWDLLPLSFAPERKYWWPLVAQPQACTWLSTLTGPFLLFPDELVQEHALQGSESEEVEHRRTGPWVPGATGIGCWIGWFLLSSVKCANAESVN